VFPEGSQERLLQVQASHRVWVGDTHKVAAQHCSEGPGAAGSAAELAEKRLALRFAENAQTLDALFGDVFGMDSNGLPEEEHPVKVARNGLSARLREFISRAASPGPRALVNVVLMAGPGLQELPWEALPFFSQPLGPEAFLQVSRDFSVALFLHRLKAIDPSTSVPSVSAGLFKHLVDPFLEARGLREAFEASVLHGMPGGRKWQPLNPNLDCPSLQDWISSLQTPSAGPTLLTASKDPKAPAAPAAPMSGLFVHTLGRLGSLLSPQALAGLDFQRLGLLCVLDRSHSDASARRQVSADVAKPAGELALEQPLVMQAS
jgi:hypothetical protein